MIELSRDCRRVKKRKQPTWRDRKTDEHTQAGISRFRIGYRLLYTVMCEQYFNTIASQAHRVVLYHYRHCAINIAKIRIQDCVTRETKKKKETVKVNVNSPMPPQYSKVQYSKSSTQPISMVMMSLFLLTV
jgi:hypothetical protein